MKRVVKRTMCTVFMAVLLVMTGCSRNSDKVQEQTNETSQQRQKYEYPQYGDYVYMAKDDGIRIREYKGNEEEINIPDKIDGKPVISLGYNSFEKISAKKVYIPDTVLEIDEYAFWDCEELEEVSGCAGVETINDRAFECCKNLKKVAMADKLKKIGKMCFRDCDKLESIAFPGSLQSIGAVAFADCDELSYVEIPYSVSYIGLGAFSETKWFDGLQGNVIVGDNVLIHHATAAEGDGENVWIPQGVKMLSTDMVEDQVTKNLYIPDSVETIGGYYFSEMSGATVYIPSSVKYIDYYEDRDFYSSEKPFEISMVVEKRSVALRFARKYGIPCKVVDDVQAVYESTLAEHEAGQSE